MNVLNAILTAVSGAMLAPVARWPAWLVLVIVSAVSGVALAALFGRTSNQRALKAVAGRSRAQLMCMRLFKDDVKVALRCQWDLLKATGLRLWHSLPPMAVAIVPFVLVLAQLSLFFEHRPPAAGERVVVTLRAAPGRWADVEATTIQAPYGVAVETPALRDEGDRSVWWRLRIDDVPAGPLRWHVGGDLVEKSLVGGGAPALRAVSALRPGPGLWDRLLFPGEPGFPRGSAVESVEVRYPPRSTPILGFDVPWWGTFLIVSMLAAIVARPFLRVQF